MSSVDKLALKALGNELMGSSVYKDTYSSSDRDLTLEEQLVADRNLKAFKVRNEGDVLIAEIPFQPLTTLTQSEYRRISALLDFELDSDEIWDRFLAEDLTLDVA